MSPAHVARFCFTVSISLRHVPEMLGKNKNTQSLFDTVLSRCVYCVGTNMEKVVAASAFVVIAGAYCELKKKRRKRPRWWIRSFLARRDSEGAYNSLMRDLRLQSGFDNFVRMTAADFELLLNLIGPEITKSRSCRLPISPGEMLAATLRYLATGDSYSSIMYLHRISKASISRFIPVVCKAIVSSLKDYIQVNKFKFIP